MHTVKLGICTLGFVKSLKIFGEMLAAVFWDGGGEVIFVTLSVFVFQTYYVESRGRKVCVF